MKFRPSGQFFAVQSFAKFEFNELQNYPGLLTLQTKLTGLGEEKFRKPTAMLIEVYSASFSVFAILEWRKLFASSRLDFKVRKIFMEKGLGFWQVRPWASFYPKIIFEDEEGIH